MHNFKNKLWGIAMIAVIALGLLRVFLLAPYRAKSQFSSPIAGALQYFSVTTNVHHDSVSGCWYDSGDYLIFLSRNALATWYLSLAYKESTDDAVRADIRSLLTDQLTCMDRMVELDIKQFRDQKNHGVNLPPALNEIFYPQGTYSLQEGEGRDVALLLALIYENINEPIRRDEYIALAKRLTRTTSSEHCCEEGVLVMSNPWLQALETLGGLRTSEGDTALWGVQPPAIAALMQENYASVGGVLSYVQENFSDNGSLFQYIGGNYDIAGTIALERLYAERSGDQQYKNLSLRLMAYLEGENAYHVNFTRYPNPYHPCAFFRACTLEDALVNGVDERGKIPPETEPWRVAEVQTYGQAIYVLTKVLMMESGLEFSGGR